MRFLVTGGAGFIGSAVVRRLVSDDRHEVMTLDALTYAGNLESLDGALDNPRHHFERADICDRATVRTLLTLHEPDAILHLAAESHVDRSIDGAADFVQTNLVGTFILLDEALRYWHGLDPSRRSAFRFVHVSSDEVFGSIASDAPPFSEDSRYDPTSPYAATKAGSDHLARAWHRTHGLPVIVTNCSNNYGPYQFPEKLIPLMILNALEGQTLPVYGQGDNIRDWLYVEDHVDALLAVVERGRIGETYAIGGRSERRNIEIVRSICALIDEMRPDTSIGPRENLIRYVSDRPGHDHRYAIDPGKAERDLGWSPRVPLASGLRRTVTWYLENPGWTARVQSGEYRRARLGLGASA